MRQGGPGEDPEGVQVRWKLCDKTCVACFGPVECLGRDHGNDLSPPCAPGYGGRRMSSKDALGSAGWTSADRRPARPVSFARVPGTMTMIDAIGKE